MIYIECSTYINVVTIYEPPWTLVGSIVNPIINKRKKSEREFNSLSHECNLERMQ
jgi:hypothetical protein